MGGLITLALAEKYPQQYDGGLAMRGESILTALAFDARGADDPLDRTHGHSPFWNNSDSYYTSSSLPAGQMALINAGAMKFDETPDAANYLANYYQPTGELTIPMVAIHATRDPVVPIFHEGLYAGLTTKAGAAANLVQRSVERYGPVGRGRRLVYCSEPPSRSTRYDQPS